MVPEIRPGDGATEPTQEGHVKLSRQAVRNGTLDAIGTAALLGFSLLSLFIGV